MTTTARKVTIAAVLAAALGVGGTLAVQRIVAPETPPADPAAVADAHAGEIAKRDAEIARLRTQLADASRRRAAPRSAVETEQPPAPPPAESPRTVVAPKPADAPPPKPTLDFAKATKRTEEWQASLRQVADAAKRDAAWAEVRQALAGADRTALLAALQATAFTTDVKLDRTGIRDLLLPSVDAAESSIRLMAWQALTNNGIEAVDVEKLRGQVLEVEKGLRPQMVQRFAWAQQRTKGAIDGPAADTVLQVLADPALAKDTVWALNGAKLNDAVVAKVLEYARTSPDAAQHAVHFVLRSLPDKNRDVVAFLLDRAEAGDMSAIEQLRWGIRAEDAAYAGDRMRKLFDARSQPYVREQLLRTIGDIGDASSRDWLTALRDDAAQTDQIRAAARGALQSLDRPRR